MNLRPDFYQGILFFGGGSPNPDSGEASAKIGGLWAQPDLGLSYLLAARHVIEAGEREHRMNEVAVPVAYLQRHALELFLKEVRDNARHIRADQAFLERLRKTPDARRDEIATDKDFVHDLCALLQQVRRALASIGFSLPVEIEHAVERLHAVDSFDENRLRYSRAGPRTSQQQSFRALEVLPLGENQKLLERLFESVFRYEGDDAEEENLATALGHEATALAQAIEKLDPNLHTDEST